MTEHIAGLINFKPDTVRRVPQGDPLIHETLRQVAAKDPAHKENKFLGSGRELAEAMDLAPSIDTFLHTHSANEEFKLLGKLGIARAILKAEAASKLAPRNDKPFKMRPMADTWYVSLAQHLFSGVAADNPKSAFENVSFIVFNYDRCLEIFLVRALCVYFQIPAREAVAIVAGLNIIHPYGSLGSLTEGDRHRAAFGDLDCNLLSIAGRILTFSESIDDEELVQQIKVLVAEAETLVFLGFAFHEQNMKLLGDDVPKQDKQSATQRVYATTHGLSASDAGVVKSQIAHLIRGRPQKARDNYSIELFSGECRALFAEYWRSLSASLETQRALTGFDAL
nr:hypothetical protein [Sphingomonas sp. CDS-1]